jgi:hypothetical protein
MIIHGSFDWFYELLHKQTDRSNNNNNNNNVIARYKINLVPMIYSIENKILILLIPLWIDTLRPTTTIENEPQTVESKHSNKP